MEIKETEEMTKKVLREFKAEKTEELEWELRFLTLTDRSFKKPSNYEEEKEARKETRKCMKEIERFETKIENIKELIIEIIEYVCSKIISDLNFEKGF